MKKKASTQLVNINESENQLAQIIPIRTETVLSQYPLHRLCKNNEPLQVYFTKTNERGRVTTTWKVSPNPEYGEPGILAYKLDTLVVNRRIDELRKEVPELLCIGNWAEIQELLGVKTRNLKALKNAFSQNAGALITAKLDYTGKDGTTHTIELRSTRYGVIFVGERLPDGTKADAVYLALNPAFREVIRQAKTRPLDYEYLKALPPASQRLYELISYQIFAALKHDNPRAKYLYSDLCKYAPLNRYYEWEKVKKQLYKIHQPHKASGYIKAIEFEQIQDSEGKADWLMWYTPGRKAKHEFREFTTRKDKQISLASQRPLLVVSNVERKADAQTATQQAPEDLALIEKLTGYGIDETRAARLIETDRGECELWAAAWPHQNQKGMENPPAVLIRFIETKRRPLPKGYKDAIAHEESQKKREEEQRRELAEETYFQFFEPPYRAHQLSELKAIQEAAPEAYAAFESWLNQNHARKLRMVTSDQRRQELTTGKAAEFFNELRPDLGFRLSDFATWDEEQNANGQDPLEWYKQGPKRIHDELDRRLRAGN